jgi:hypothetical protein
VVYRENNFKEEEVVEEEEYNNLLLKQDLNSTRASVSQLVALPNRNA